LNIFNIIFILRIATAVLDDLQFQVENIIMGISFVMRPRTKQVAVSLCVVVHKHRFLV